MARTAIPCFPKGTGSRTPCGNRSLRMLQPLSAPSIPAGYEAVDPTSTFHLWLVESASVQPTGVEAWLYPDGKRRSGMEPQAAGCSGCRLPTLLG